MDCYIKQLNERDCAFASLKMILAYYSKNKEYLYLKQNLDKKDYSLFEIIEIGKKYGLTLQGIKVNDLNEPYKLDSKPFLAMLKNKDDTSHLVFVRKIYKKKLLIYDPKNGKYKMDLSTFKEKFTGIFLKVSMFNEVNFKSSEERVVNKGKIVSLCLFKSLTSVFLLLGFFFLNENSHFLVPLSFVAVFVIFSMISNLLTKHESYNFDKRISGMIFKRKNKQFERDYEAILRYKTMMFNAPISIVSNFLISIFFIVTSIMNDTNCIFVFTTIFFIALIDYFVFKSIKSKFNLKMVDIETQLARVDLDKATFIDKYEDLSNVSSNFSSFLLLRKYLISFIMFCIAFLLMALEGKITLNFLLFNYLIFDITYQSLEKILSFTDTNEEYKMLKAKFVSLLNV